MIKLLAFDLDNTLLEKNNEIPPHVCDILTECDKKGIELVIATGRMYPSAKTYADMIDKGCGIVCYNGSKVYDRTANVLKEDSLSVETMRALIDFTRENNLYVQFYEDDKILVERECDETRIDPDMDFAEVIEAEDFDAYRLKPSPKALVVVTPEKLPEYQRLLAEKLGDSVHLAQSQPYLIEVMSYGVDKAKALDYLCRELNIHAEEAMVFGDSSNDLEMIEWAGIGVAVANSQDVVKAAADYVCSKERSEGVAEAILRFI